MEKPDIGGIWITGLQKLSGIYKSGIGKGEEL